MNLAQRCGRIRDSPETRDASCLFARALVWWHRRRSDVEAASAGRGRGGGGGAAQARGSPGGMPCSGCARCCSCGGGWRARAHRLAPGAGVAGGWFARCGCRVTAALANARGVCAPCTDAVVRPGSTGPVDGHGVSSRPPLKKTKRMDRRLRATGRLQTTNVKAQRCFPRLSPAHAMFEFKQCALSRTPRPPHPHCGHTHVPPFSPQSPHPSHVQHRPLFRCGDSTVLSAVPLPRPAAHPLAAAHASAVAPAASLDPLRPRAPNGQRMARHRCSTARRGSQHYDRCRGGNNQPPYRATSQDVQKTLNTNYNYLKDLFYAHLPPQVRDVLGSPCHFWARPPCHFWARHPSKRP